VQLLVSNRLRDQRAITEHILLTMTSVAGQQLLGSVSMGNALDVAHGGGSEATFCGL